MKLVYLIPCQYICGEAVITDFMLQGSIGEAMSPRELSEVLSQRDLFLYCGHGCAQHYVHLKALRQSTSCSAALLMGCSSGRLTNRGRYEACGPILSYLQAGKLILY